MSSNSGGFSSLAVDVFVSVLLNLGSKSFSHSFAALTRYHKTLKALTEGNEEAQMVVLRSLYELWSSHQQMMIVLVDKLLKMQIVECNCVVAWIFADDMRHEFCRMWTWEILQSALVKLNRHVHRVRSDFQSIQLRSPKTEPVTIKDESHEQSQEDGMDDDKNDEDKSLSDLGVGEMAQKLQSAEEFQKNLLLSVFHKFTVVLTEHLLTSESEGKDFNTNWYKYISGRFKHCFLSQLNEVWKLCDELQTSLFTSDIDAHILENFHQFRALRR